MRQPIWDGRLEPRLDVRRERRRQRARGTDSLTAESVRFLEVRPGLSHANGPVEASASLERRTEQRRETESVLTRIDGRAYPHSA